MRMASFRWHCDVLPHQLQSDARGQPVPQAEVWQILLLKERYMFDPKLGGCFEWKTRAQTRAHRISVQICRRRRR